MREIEKIIIHCADSKHGMDIGVEEIRKWHTEERGFSDVGYHFIIRKDGTLETGRDVEKTGAHCFGHNSKTIGICWVGGYGGDDDRTEEQIYSLKNILKELRQEYPSTTIHGHNEFSSKSCPNFDVKEEYKTF